MENEIKYASINDVKAVKEDRIIEFVATKEIKDYDNDIVKVDGMDISKIKKNKSFLWSHIQSSPPVGKILKLWKDGKTIKGKAQMTSEEEYPFGFQIYKLIKGGYINNVSISFIPDYKSIEYNEKTESRIINKATMLEISAVNIGANSGTSIEAKAFKTSINKAIEDKVVDESILVNLEKVNEPDPKDLMIEAQAEKILKLEQQLEVVTKEENIDDVEIEDFYAEVLGAFTYEATTEDLVDDAIEALTD